MKAEDVTDKIWHDVVLGGINDSFEFLAFKILLARIRNKVKTDSSPAVVKEAAAELKALFIKFENLPNAQKDLAKIMKKGA